MISITILTKNSEKHLEKVLEALRSFGEVLIYDTGSTDRTLDIASGYPNVTIVQGVFDGFGNAHNKASSMARNDWILSIDSDEVLTSELKEEIAGLKLDPLSVYSFPRKNFYNGKWIKWCGWHPDRVVRLYNKRRTSFTDCDVHERVISEGLGHCRLTSSVEHYPYGGTRDFLAKMQHYSDLFARQNRGKKKSSFAKALWRGWFTFFKSYILKRGFLGGKEGFIISLYNANTAFYKYIKLMEANRQAALEFSCGPKKTEAGTLCPTEPRNSLRRQTSR
jgi:glycosyltransferase involved in cell wall biosynthesis